MYLVLTFLLTLNRDVLILIPNLKLHSRRIGGISLEIEETQFFRFPNIRIFGGMDRINRIWTSGGKRTRDAMEDLGVSGIKCLL